MQLKSKQVPILITWDVDPDRWATVDHREKALSITLDLCEKFCIHSTFFITANYAHEYPTYIKRMQLLSQEIGCHGLMHIDEEDYDRMPPDLQRTFITEATHKLETAAGSSICSFRSPRVKTSAHTLKLLSDHGYLIDSSVCSQRIDFVSSNLINLGWILAPRLPYRPHPANAYRRGSLSIWEVPISAAIVPFISSSLKVMGLRWMKALFWMLYKESRITGKPIVYLAHPTEFISLNRPRTKLTLADFSPSRVRTHGFLARNFMFRLRGKVLYEATRELFSYISSLPDIAFMTCNEYIGQLNQTAGLELS